MECGVEGCVPVLFLPAVLSVPRLVPRASLRWLTYQLTWGRVQRVRSPALPREWWFASEDSGQLLKALKVFFLSFWLLNKIPLKGQILEGCWSLVSSRRAPFNAAHRTVALRWQPGQKSKHQQALDLFLFSPAFKSVSLAEVLVTLSKQCAFLSRRQANVELLYLLKHPLGLNLKEGEHWWMCWV